MERGERVGRRREAASAAVVGGRRRTGDLVYILMKYSI